MAGQKDTVCGTITVSLSEYTPSSEEGEYKKRGLKKASGVELVSFDNS